MPFSPPPLKVLIWGINYAPEPTGIGPFNTDLARYLAEQGHRVTMVTSFAYYPNWKREPGDDGRWRRSEKDGAVSVERCWCHVPGVVTTPRRILHELSFVASSLWRVLREPTADVMVVVSPPLALGAAAWVAAKLKGNRFIFHVQDLQPDAAMVLGMVNEGLLAKIGYALEGFAYRKAALVSGISEGMLEAFRRKGVAEARRALLPNWLRGPASTPVSPERRAAARVRFGVSDDTLLAVYSGNIGKKQNLEMVGAAARLLPEPAGTGRKRVRILVSGAGAGRAAFAASLEGIPAERITLLPLLDDEAYRDLQLAADVGLITQVTGTGQFFFPSKLLTILQQGTPIVAVADAESELSRAVVAGEFGCVVRPDSPEELAKTLDHLATDATALDRWRTRTGWVNQFERSAVLSRFEQTLRRLVSEEPRGGAPVPASATPSSNPASI